MRQSVPVSDRPLTGYRVLVVTDRPFMSPVDGSAHTYLMWLQILRELGCTVSVLSFDRETTRWSADDRSRLATLTASSLIVRANGSRLGTLTGAAIAAAWRTLAGRRYLPAWVETALQRAQRDKLAAFLKDGAFQAVVLNKLHTTQLIGRDVLRSIGGRKIIDIHDNYPMRETLNRRVMLGLARHDWRSLRTILRPRDVLELANWAGVDRKLAEEADRLADFDHVVFNAQEEAEVYIRAGVPRSKVAILPLPRPQDQTRPNAVSSAARPFAIGLIGADSVYNIEGLYFLLQDVMPALRDRGARLLVAGTIGRFAKPLLTAETGVALGWVESVSEFYDQVEVVVVPLMTGTGVSVKAFEAAAHGAAIVTTTIGMRGLHLQPGTDLLVADNGNAFAACILRLLDDPAFRAELRRNALIGLRRHHSRERFLRGVQDLLGHSAFQGPHGP